MQAVLELVPLLRSTANAVSLAYALTGLVSYPLLSPALVVTAEFAAGDEKPVFVSGTGVFVGVREGVCVIVGVLVAVGGGVCVLDGVSVGVWEGVNVFVGVRVGV